MMTDVDLAPAALIVVLTLVTVLVVSGAAKLRDRRATRDAFDALRVPGFVPADGAATALPWAELLLAALVLLAPAGWLVPVAGALLALMLAYTWIIARALGFEEPVTCSCFGSLGRHDVDRTTLARNVLLSVLAAAVLAYAVAGGSTFDAVAGLHPSHWWALLATVAAVAVAVLVAGGGTPRSATPSIDGVAHADQRQRIPYGAVVRRDGTTATLAQLAGSQAQLVVILNPDCGPCLRTAQRLDEWAEQLAPFVGVVAVYPDKTTASAPAGHASELATWEPDHNLRAMFAVTAPAAVLLGADGYLAGGPVRGEDEVAEFVAEVLDELEAPQTAE